MVALAHGTSDGQKTMGIITLVLISAGYQASGTGPEWWVILAAGCAIGLGTYSGGWRIMRTMGKGLCDIESPQGFAAETASTAAILVFGRDGHNLTVTVPVTFPEATLGAEVEVPTLAGTTVRLRIPAGTPNGRTFRVRGRGVPRSDGSRGDLLATVEIAVPESLDDDARHVVERLRDSLPQATPRPWEVK